MAAWIRSHAAPLPLGRRIGFFVVTVVAFVLDVLTVVPGPERRVGPRFLTWGGWETSILEFVPLVAAVYAGLLLRRRWPLVVLVGICGLSVAFTTAPVPSLPMAGVLVSLYTAAAVVDRRWQAWLALAVTLVTQWVGLILFLPVIDGDLWLGMLLLTGISYSMWVFGRRDHTASLAAAGLPDQLAEHGEQAAAHERRRIARELHDIVAHSVSAMMMQAAGAKAVTTALKQDLSHEARLEVIERALATIENTGSQSMRELHRLLSVLRGDDAELESPDAESSSQPGMADIAPLVQLTRQSGLVVEVHTAGPAVRLDPSVGLAAYRVVQESLTNAMKHGGRGAMVDIFQNWQPDGLQLQVRCREGHEGTRPGSMGGGTGLVGLRERVELVGGYFQSGWVGDEFVVTALLPLTPTVRPALGTANGTNGTTTPPANPPTAQPHGVQGPRTARGRGDDDLPSVGPLARVRADGGVRAPGIDSRLLP